MLLRCWIIRYNLWGLHLEGVVRAVADCVGYVGVEVFTAVVMKISIFWDIMPCSSSEINRRFGGTCRFHLKRQRISQASDHYEAGSKLELFM
jgi:hypothetical protein